MRTRIAAVLLVMVMVLLAACGTPSKEDVMKKLSGKWNDTKGYELQATMEIKTGAEPRLYDVTVWHTKPDFYKVNVAQGGTNESQMIIRNADGVFVVTPSLGKTYKFQSDWPTQNSMGYLIGSLSDDIKADKNAKMTEKDKTYIFETVTRNNHKKVLPTQQIHIDKKTLLPKHVSVMDANMEEKIRITFNKIALGVERKPSDFAVQMDDTGVKPEAGEEDGNEEKSDETGLGSFYPDLEWDDTTLQNEQSMRDGENTRLFLTYGGGDREFVVIQEPASAPENQLVPVSAEGDPVDLGFTVAALTDTSIRWEQDGISFFVASNTLTKDELIEVASSMKRDSVK